MGQFGSQGDPSGGAQPKVFEFCTALSPQRSPSIVHKSDVPANSSPKGGMEEQRGCKHANMKRK